MLTPIHTPYLCLHPLGSIPRVELLGITINEYLMLKDIALPFYKRVVMFLHSHQKYRRGFQHPLSLPVLNILSHLNLSLSGEGITESRVVLASISQRTATWDILSRAHWLFGVFFWTMPVLIFWPF